MKFAVIIICLLCSRSFADSVFVGTLERKGAIIKEIRGDVMSFEFNGRLNDLEIKKITRIAVDSDPPLNTAEEAYATSKWDDAVENYQKAIRSTTKSFVKDWSAMRLIDAANKSGRFDAAASAYILTLLRDPTAAESIKPAMPDSKSTFLDTSAADVNKALADPKLNVDQRRALLGFLLEIQQARKDQAAEDAAYEQLAKLPGADANDPAAKRVLAKRKLAAASRALAANNYKQAVAEIDANRAFFVDPQQQADALYILAEARYAQSGSDANSLKDAALGYMRVVAVGKDVPGRPHVVDSLLKTAEIMAKLNEPQAATQICQQIVSQYGDDPAVSRAKDFLNRLKQQASTN